MNEVKECIAVWCGRVPYAQALDLQMRICGLKNHGFEKDVLLLLEHPPVITLGRNAKQGNLLVPEALLKSRGIDLWNVDRGGDVTFHGPGQLVGYPILSLSGKERDVHGYMSNLEESLIRVLAGYGIEGLRDQKFTGVWTQNGKIAALGVHLSRWITRHGFALNVNTDLTFYDLIVPCGIVGRGVTSMQKHLLHSLDLGAVAAQYIPEFGALFNRTMIRMDEGGLTDELRRCEERGGEADVYTPRTVPVV